MIKPWARVRYMYIIITVINYIFDTKSRKLAI